MNSECKSNMQYKITQWKHQTIHIMHSGIMQWFYDQITKKPKACNANKLANLYASHPIKNHAIITDHFKHSMQNHASKTCKPCNPTQVSKTCQLCNPKHMRPKTCNSCKPKSLNSDSQKHAIQSQMVISFNSDVSKIIQAKHVSHAVDKHQ